LQILDNRLFENIYIIGFGSIGNRYFRIVNDNNLSRKTLIFDRFNNKSGGNGFNYFNKLDEIRATKDDLIIIANPASYHYETLIQLLDCAAPILLEKPLSKEILTTSKIKKLNDMFGFIHVGYNLRYHPAVKLVKGHVAKQTYGEVISIFGEVSSFLPQWRPAKDYSKTVSAQAELGGGVLLELSHEIDLINYIYKKIPTVSAQFDQVSGLKINVEDTAVLNFKFKKQGKRVLGNLNMCFASHRPSRKLLLNCTHASLELDLNANKLSIFKDNSVDVITFEKYENRDQTYIDQIKDIHLSFSKNRKPTCGILDANHALGVICAAKISKSNLSKYARVPK
jgi:predicted dehydrogenase